MSETTEAQTLRKRLIERIRKVSTELYRGGWNASSTELGFIADALAQEPAPSVGMMTWEGPQSIFDGLVRDAMQWRKQQLAAPKSAQAPEVGPAPEDELLTAVGATPLLLHVLRNPWGLSDKIQRSARLRAADLIEAWTR